MGIFQPDKMGGVDYGEALKKIETAIANQDPNAAVKTKNDSPTNMEDEEDNHDDLYNQVIDEDGDIVREGEPT